MNEKNKSSDAERQQAESSAAPVPGLETSESEAAGEPTHEELLLTLQDAQAKADEHWNQLLRVQAELDNYQRRARRELENAHKFALEKFVRELLPVIDSLELGLAAAEDQDAGDAARLREGMDLTLKMLLAAIEKFGVKPVEPEGEVFNPELHQAMTTQPTSEAAPNTVLSVYQKGYLLNDRLIRPAMVVVAAAAGKTPGQQSAENDGEKPAKIDEHA